MEPPLPPVPHPHLGAVQPDALSARLAAPGADPAQAAREDGAGRTLREAAHACSPGANGAVIRSLPHKGAAGAPAGRRKVGESGEGTSEGGTG
ncbi:hypothetical protein GCM10018980_66150 [Streptomyces capoamus]|uniref:Uncharacterized protein n=1 Tax=Streptomyces capoamus TaxID=68183 RepID=A0A919KFJ2_9ACTN|nr:hypothetical protein GCM10010501_55630 [Streptomyces libani subsp. rufus]GHG71132.1 hypothetical protein GCM10018980_66150 [Streptomyces capoamus]